MGGGEGGAAGGTEETKKKKTFLEQLLEGMKAVAASLNGAPAK
ncbi:MAG TPA: hypothetical protein VIG99_24080 [Myxococcaceae bacterium]